MEKRTNNTYLAALLTALFALLGLLAFAGAPPVNAQQVTISGKLFADHGDLTDALLVVELEEEQCLRSVLLHNGRFEFKVPLGAKARLIFLKSGHLTKEVLVDTRNALNTSRARKLNKNVKFDVVLESTEERKHQAYYGPVGYIHFVNGTGLMRVRHDERLVEVAEREED
jgi:hypothetical protein